MKTLKPGDTIQVTTGPMKSHKGRILRRDGSNIYVEFVGVAGWIPVADVRQIGKNPKAK